MNSKGPLYFATSIGFEQPNKYQHPVKVRFNKGHFQGELSGNIVFHENELTNLDNSKIYDTTIKEVISVDGHYAVKLEWTEDDKKSYNVSFEIVEKVFEGNHILLRSNKDGVKLVDAGLIYVHESTRSDDSIIPYSGVF